MSRVIRWFNRHNDDYVSEVNLPHIELEILQKQFGVDSNDQVDPLMYACYRVEDCHQKFFSTYVAYKFDFNKYEYFLEYYAH